MAGKKGRSGRKPLAQEIEYLDAVRRGAPVKEVEKAVRACMKKAQTGDSRALVAVLQYLVPVLSHATNDLAGELVIHIVRDSNPSANTPSSAAANQK